MDHTAAGRVPGLKAQRCQPLRTQNPGLRTEHRSGPHRSRAHVGPDPLDDLLRRRARREDLATPRCFSSAMSSGGMMPPPKMTTSPTPFCFSTSITAAKSHMRTGQDAQPDRVDILLQRRFGDHLRRLMQAGVDDFDARVAQGTRNDLGAAIVPVQPGLGDEYATAWLRLQMTLPIR